MNKAFIAAIAATTVLAAPAFAESTNAKIKAVHEEKAEVKASEGAIAKDNAAIAKQRANIAENRAEKAEAKAEGNLAVQAGESVSIGANKAVIGAKKLERSVDQEILEKDRRDLQKAKEAATSPAR